VDEIQKDNESQMNQILLKGQEAVYKMLELYKESIETSEIVME
jgi:hypothetical protein